MKLSVTVGTQPGRVDVKKTAAGQLGLVRSQQIHMVIGISEFPELRRHVGPHLVAALAYTRPNGGMNVFRAAGKPDLHRFNGMDRDLLRGATPTGMDRSHDSLARIDKENWNTIRSLDGNQPPWRILHQRVPLTEATGATSGIHNDGRVDLMKRGQIATTTKIFRPPSAEAVHQPVECLKRPNPIDLLRVLVKHYAGF
jgi:hypothetical protein